VPSVATRTPNWAERKDAETRERGSGRHFQNPLEPVPEAVEIVLTLSAPIPARAIGPVLHVGGQRLSESEAVDKTGTKVRFWGLTNPS
jgi:hypothetical protein